MEETAVGVCCICPGPLGQSDSNGEKCWTPSREFRIARHHTPGDFNYLDICWVTNTAIRWSLNYVEDSFMRQHLRI